MNRHAAEIAAALFAVSGTASFAQSGASADDVDGWTFTAAPYLLAPALDGDVALRGRESEVDVGQSEIFSDLNLGFMGYFEARDSDRWGFAADVIYASLDGNDDASLAEVDLTQGIYTGAVLARVAPGLDLYGGARLVSLDTTVDFHGPLGLDTVDRDQTWVDPVIGGRVAVPLGDRWDFRLSADVGGFGLGSDISANVWPVVTYRFSPALSGAAGYRALYIDYDEGTGTDLFAYDVLMHGPMLGLVAHF